MFPEVIIPLGAYVIFFSFYMYRIRKNILKANRIIMKRQEEALTKMDETNKLLAEIRDSLKAK